MKIENVLFGILFLGAFIFGGYSLMQYHVDEYDIGDADTSKLGAVSNQIDPIMNETAAMQNAISGDGVSEESAEDDMFKGGFRAISNVWQSIRIMTNATGTIVKDINAADEHTSNFLPTIIAYLFAALGIGIAVYMLYMVFRFKPQ